ncbi:GrpB family protein [Agromyces protaetiae]|uniref:GrpB family protein n=1 Tax=Agromyces protaetiae TaxID=2509455 RepID=A0A4P6FU14_9MICO|nr:GrpB family protein [Agromyces protaetiae]QAY74048.1 GrpB family protein [Agromyces protaetiae]
MGTQRGHRRPDVTELELVGGPEPLVVGLQEFDEHWAIVYRDHERRIRDALSPAPVEIEHIGSTSVPGLAAKPIVDIVVAVDDITAEEDYLEPLLSAGYVLRVREPGHRMVRTPQRDIHVHVFERADPAIEEYLLFRDRLRTDADDRALYERTKRALIDQAWEDMNDYADAKTDVIVAIKARARSAAEAEEHR